MTSVSTLIRPGDRVERRATNDIDTGRVLEVSVSSDPSRTGVQGNAVLVGWLSGFAYWTPLDEITKVERYDPAAKDWELIYWRQP